MSATGLGQPLLMALTLVIAYRLILGLTGGTFRRRARMDMHSLAGGTLALVLAALEIAALTFDLGMNVSNHTTLVSVAVVGSAALLIPILGGRAGEALIGLTALTAFTARQLLHEGSVVAAWFGVVAIAMVLALALIRAVLGR